MRFWIAIAVWVSVALLGAIVGPVFPVWAENSPAPAASAPAEPVLTPQEQDDLKIGKQAAEEIEKELKVIDNYSGLSHIQEIVDAIRPFTEKPNQKYIIKVADTKAINAFSLPGGYIYFTKGLLEAVESDDELAAVAGHEMGHVCLNHARRLMAKDEKYNKILGPIVLAAILGASSGDRRVGPDGRVYQTGGINPGEVALIGSLIKQDAVNHYGREAEFEADSAAIRYLNASKKYLPVAVLTVVEGLAKIDASQPTIDQGVFQTHPYASERVVAVRKQLEDLKVPIERPRVRKGITAIAGPIQKDGKEIGELRLDDFVVFQPAVEVDGLSPVARAQHCADLLNPLLIKEIELVDISTTTQGDTALLQAHGDTILKITPADAAFHNTTVDALAKQAMHAIQLAFYTENTKRAY